MSVLSKIIGSNVAQPVEAVGNVLDKLFTSDEEKMDRKEAMTRLLQQPGLAQIEVNKIEAQHRSVFVAGWRPAIGWVCAIGLLFVFLVNPMIQWWTGKPGPILPLDYLDSLVWALLGLGTMRMAEKMTGRAK